MRSRYLVAATAFAFICAGAPSASVAAAAPPGPRGGTASSWSDFNADGFDDLAIGAPFDRVGTKLGAGVVHVLYGSATGLRAAGSQLWSEDVADVAGTALPGDHFGMSVAPGDFNDDDFGDLAVGVPDKDDPHGSSGRIADAGEVHIFYGSATGLTATDDWVLRARDVLTSTAGLQFGFAVAALDTIDFRTDLIGRDGMAELAIGAPGSPDGGTAVVIKGLQIPHSSSTAYQLPSAGQPGARAGASLAVGDFDNGIAQDLAVGVPRFDLSSADLSIVDAGIVAIVLNGVYREFVVQGFQDSHEIAEPNDRFGSVLAANDLDGDGRSDLVVGVPLEDVGGVVNAGAVQIFFGATAGDGLDLTTDVVLTQEAAGVPGTSATNDRFGAALAIADFGDTLPMVAATGTRGGGGGTREADLAIGRSGKDVAGIDRAGDVVLLYFHAGAIVAAASQVWSQASAEIPDAPEVADKFGSTLASGEYGRAGRLDLAIGIPTEDIGTRVDAGEVQVLYSDDHLLTASGNQAWNQDTPGISGQAQAGDRFGAALGAPVP